MTNYPVNIQIEYPEKLSRGHLLLKLFFAPLYVYIPHGFLLFFYAIGVMVVSFIAWWAILFTGRYPRGMFDYVVGFKRWLARVNAYVQGFTDVYPPFSGKE
jgi:hypothetical protein